MSKQLILKEHGIIKMQCPKCLSWVRYSETICTYCAYPLNFKNRYKKSLIRFLENNLKPIKSKK